MVALGRFLKLFPVHIVLKANSSDHATQQLFQRRMLRVGLIPKGSLGFPHYRLYDI